MSCMTRYTVTVGTSFGHAVDEAKSESKTKRLFAASVHLPDYMDEIIHVPSKWHDLEHFHMTHEFWGGGVITYLGKHAKIRIWGRFLRARTKLQKQLMRVGKSLGIILFCCYVHHKSKIIKGCLISWSSNPVQPIWEI